MAFPIIRDIVTGDAQSPTGFDTTSVTFILPPGHQEGDLLLWIFSVDGLQTNFTLNG
jgi:hypothetical protein